MAHEKESKAPEKGKKKNFFKRVWNGLTSWLRSMKSELKKVVWPTPKHIANNTLVVLVVMVACAIVLWGFDYVASLAISLLVGLGS